MLIELFTQQRHHIHRRLDIRIGQLRRPPRHPGDIEARSGPRFQQPLRHQPVVSLGHGVLRHAMILGRAAHRGQPVAGLQAAGGDLPRQKIDQMIDAGGLARQSCGHG